MGHLLTEMGVPFLYESYRIAYSKTHHYIPDFRICRPDGSSFYVEVKGRFFPSDRTKHLLIKKQRPDLDIRFVFQQPNHKLYPGSKTTYAQWCEKNDFKYSGKKLPKEWFEI